MKINLAKSAGFCFGVKRAIRIARELASKGEHVCMLGDIVHNEDVISEMELLGIRKIRKLGRCRDRALLIRAHGAARATFEAAKRNGYAVVDATCPMVMEIHRIARDLESREYRVVVIGDRRHDEVAGIVGQLRRRAIVIEGVGDMPRQALKRVKRAGIVVQSTQNIDNVMPVLDELRRIVPDIEFHNTICSTTRRKQKEIRKLPLHNDVVIVIGSRTSANTRRLFEIAKSLNRKTHWIQNAKDLRKTWFRGAESVGVTAGASTPDYTTRSVIKRIAGFDQGHGVRAGSRKVRRKK